MVATDDTLISLRDLVEILPDLIADAIRNARPVSLPGAVTKQTGTVVTAGISTAEVQLDADEPGILTTVQLGGDAEAGDRVVILLEENGGAVTVGKGSGSSAGGLPALAVRVAALELGRPAFNVLNYGARNDYNGLDPDVDSDAADNLAANTLAFELAKADAKAVAGYVKIPAGGIVDGVPMPGSALGPFGGSGGAGDTLAGNYCLGPGVLETDRDDYGIICDDWRVNLWFKDTKDGDICVDFRQTFVDNNAKISRQHRVTGLTINGRWATHASIGFRFGPGLDGFFEVRCINFLSTTGDTRTATGSISGATLTTTGLTALDHGALVTGSGVRQGTAIVDVIDATTATITPAGQTCASQPITRMNSNGVVGVTGSIGILCQNTLMAAGALGVTEAFKLGPDTRLIECNIGICYDRNDGHQSIGYQDHPHVVTRDCRIGILIVNGAWLYHTDVRWEMVISDQVAWRAASPYDVNKTASGSIAGTALTTTGLRAGDVGALVLPAPTVAADTRITAVAKRTMTGSIAGVTMTGVGLTGADVGSSVTSPDVQDGTVITGFTNSTTVTVNINQTVASSTLTVWSSTAATVDTSQTVAATPLTISRRDVIGVSVIQGNLITPAGGADPRPGSRLMGAIQMDFEKNDPGTNAWTTSCAPRHLDEHSMMKTSGWIDNLTAGPILPISTLLGVNHHDGPVYESPAPFPMWQALMAFDGDDNTDLNRVGDYQFNVKGNWTRVLQNGTLLRWRSPVDLGFRYGRVDAVDFGSTVTNHTTVILEQIVTPKAIPLYMDAQPMRGSMEWYLAAPIDVPAELLEGWKPIVPCAYVSASSFDLAGNWTKLLTLGVKLRLKQGGNTKWFYCLGASFSAGRTLVTVTAGTDDVIANAAISSPQYSFETPPDFPGFFNYMPTYPAGFSAGNTPANNPSPPNYRFRIDDSWCTIHMIEATGTSNAATFQIGLPPNVVARAAGGPWKGAVQVRNNGTIQTAPGLAVIASGDNKIQIGINWQNVGGFTASGLKNVVEGQISYEVQPF